ncbi:MAG TPA: winged helix-turn-helix domain-containing protein [Verrucomicrobiae bacterium]|nr:winged helix-turn-helix domain-containing protein [Verrucomicrobiae bacterium]
MSEGNNQPRLFRFGVFELDSDTGELRKDGKSRPRIRDQALQILIMLLEKSDEVVSRDELRERLWPADTFVDFDHGLNTAINQVRTALGDSAANPKFIQTLLRRGYRFIGPVQIVGRDGAAVGSENNGRSIEGHPKTQVHTSTAKLGHPENQVHTSTANLAHPETHVRDSTADRGSKQPVELLTPTAGAEMRSSILSDPRDLPAVRKESVRILFSLIQLMYLIFYIIFLVRLRFAEEVLNDWGRYAFTVLMVLVLAAAIGIPVRLYLLTAMAFRYQGLTGKFRKLFPFLLVLDEMWALTPFLCVQQIGLGVAIATAAALLYLPFSQRTLLLMGEQ